MKALIVIAHGSRRRESNDEIVNMVDRIRSLDRYYDHVAHSFLEICQPTLPEAVSECIGKGAIEVTVYPFFLNSGNHVQRDIPEMISELNRIYPDCEIRLLPHFGKSEDIARLIMEHVRKPVQVNSGACE